MTGVRGARRSGTVRAVAALATVLGLLMVGLLLGGSPAAAEVDADGNRRLGPVTDDDGADVGTAGVEVDDPLRDSQWYLDRIRIPEAWETSRGEGVQVAIIDTGVDPYHRDLSGAFWLSEQTGTPGYDYVRGTADTYVGPAEDWHGTAVAGVLAARADDGYGMAGTAPQIQTMVYRIYRSTSTSQPPNQANYSDASSAIRAAVLNGADVLLLTWGGTNPNAELYRAIRDADVPVVAAAGNDGQDLSDFPDITRYPAAFRLPNLVTVAASGRDDRLLSGDDGVISNHGVRHVDLAAPGDEIVSLEAGSSHALFAGTSFAAPQVAGALALGVSRFPDAAPSELVATVVATARPTSALRGQVTSSGVLDVGAFLWASRRPACGEGVEPVAFTDLDPNSTHADNIACMVAYGITRGVDDERFAPQRTVTRQEMAAFIARTLDSAGHEVPEDLDSPFEDTADSLHAHAIDVIADAGITQGVGDDRFDPRGEVTRGQMAAFVVRTVEFLFDSELDGDRWWFDDIDGHTHERAIIVARNLGITFGGADPREFAPNDGITREQMGSFVARLLDVLGRADVALEPAS